MMRVVITFPIPLRFWNLNVITLRNRRIAIIELACAG
jgi:hypothetical protein